MKAKLKPFILWVSVSTFVAVGIWICIGLRFGLWTCSDYGRYSYLTRNLPIARELWHGNVKAGDKVEKIIKDWPPDSIKEFVPWVELQWFPGGLLTNSISFVGIRVIAKNGMLVSANCYSDDGIGSRIFFETETPTEKTNFLTAYRAYVERLQRHSSVPSSGNTASSQNTNISQISR